MSNAVQLAKHYFDLSNEGRLSEIKKLFTASTTYSSDNTGLYLGADQIMEMQKAFFADFETLSWTVRSVEEVKPGIVLFDFTFSGKTTAGDSVSRDGLEYVIVHQDKIQHIEVRSRD